MSLATAVTIYVVNDYLKSIINHLGYIYRDSRSAQALNTSRSIIDKTNWAIIRAVLENLNYRGSIMALLSIQAELSSIIRIPYNSTLLVRNKKKVYEVGPA